MNEHWALAKTILIQNVTYSSSLSGSSLSEHLRRRFMHMTRNLMLRIFSATWKHTRMQSYFENVWFRRKEKWKKKQKNWNRKKYIFINCTLKWRFFYLNWTMQHYHAVSCVWKSKTILFFVVNFDIDRACHVFPLTEW